MKVNLLDDKRMRGLGFTDHRKGKWYYVQPLGREISFNMTIDKQTKKLEIEVLDDYFLQHYDFQLVLDKYPNHNVASEVDRKVKDIIMSLVDEGLIVDYEVGDYI